MLRSADASNPAVLPSRQATAFISFSLILRVAVTAISMAGWVRNAEFAGSELCGRHHLEGPYCWRWTTLGDWEQSQVWVSECNLPHPHVRGDKSGASEGRGNLSSTQTKILTLTSRGRWYATRKVKAFGNIRLQSNTVQPQCKLGKTVAGSALSPAPCSTCKPQSFKGPEGNSANTFLPHFFFSFFTSRFLFVLLGTFFLIIFTQTFMLLFLVIFISSMYLSNFVCFFFL